MFDHGRNQICLSDGRRLVFSLAGPGGGIPVVYCHGAIGTALEASVDLESTASELGIRHIAICRPGIGGSDPAPGRDLLSFADDTRELADVLCEALGELALPLIRRHPRLLSRVIAAHAAPEERRLLHTAGERTAATTSFLTAADQGVGGMIDDYLVYAGPWGFDPGEVTTDVHLWHGARDPLVPLEHALGLAVTLPHSQLFVAADEGHHFFRRRLRRILAMLVGRELGAQSVSRRRECGISI